MAKARTADADHEGWEEVDPKAREHMERDKATVLGGFWPKIGALFAQVPFAEELLTAYYCAFDRTTPFHVRAGLLAALAYFVLPFDFMPDLLPIIGLSDDAAVLAAAIKLVFSHIEPEHRTAAREAMERLGG